MVAVGLVAVTMGASSSALTPAPAPVQPVVALPAGPALQDTPAPNLWGTNGRVSDLAVSPDGRYAYLGGAFDYVGPTTGHAVTTAPSPDAGTVVNGPALGLDGTVSAAIPGRTAGEWYLGGSFTRAGGARHVGLAHVLADGTVDASFTPAVTGSVAALALSSDGTTLLVGGSFTGLRGSNESTDTARTNLAAVDAVTGFRSTAFTAQTNAAVTSLVVTGDRVYVGGAFTTAAGAARAGVARVAVATGALDAFAPAFLGGPVRSLAVAPGASSDTDTVYAGGDFTSVRPTTTASARSRLAAVSGAGALLTWTASTNASVTSLALSPDTQSLLVGGSFTQLGVAARSGFGRVAAVSSTAYPSGTVMAADARLSGCHLPHGTQNTNTFYPCSLSVQSVAWSPDGQTAYVGGNFTRALGSVRHDAAALSLPAPGSPGALTAWAPMPSATVDVVTATATGVLLGGDLQSANGIYRRGLARIDLSTGQADPGFTADLAGFAGGSTGPDGSVLDLELDAAGTSLYVGGYFASVNTTPHAGVVKVAAATGVVDAAFRATTDKGVQALAVRGTSVFLGGAFTQVGTVTRQHAAKVAATTGAVDPTWVANATDSTNPVLRGGNVFGVAVTRDGSRAFLAGGFTVVNGRPVSGGIVAIDGRSGAVLPSPLGGVVPPCPGKVNYIVSLYLSPDDQRLYGGDLCPDYTYQWDAVRLAAGPAPQGLIWRQWCNGGMQARLEVNGTFYYGTHGGDAGRGGYCAPRAFEHSETPQQRVAAWRASDGMLLSWAPFFDSPMGVWSYAVVPGTAAGTTAGLLVGGDFTVVGGRGTLQQGLVLLPGTP
ncbi:hypothetical protein GCM10009814_30760 [Lapillicoccus jejuensis]|uniref:Beta-propeller uncharacterized protein DUF5122 n=1 Tax=Lapillicoccus jejuensis TaxID=402171 RepID=A0A542E230_9MICO|nr:beta-propeller uncharacterized protein DUF5122 [Lapillicoccus jejuensis]